MRKLLAALLPCLAPAALAGPYDQPWAVITSDHAGTDAKVRPVVVSRVDGEIVPKSRATVAPGTRQVTVDLPPRKGFSVGTQETFELVANPCMRYSLAAQPDAQSGREWKAFVRSSQSIGECLAKFKGGGEPR